MCFLVSRSLSRYYKNANRLIKVFTVFKLKLVTYCLASMQYLLSNWFLDGRTSSAC